MMYIVAVWHAVSAKPQSIALIVLSNSFNWTFAKMIYYALHAYTMAYNSYSVVFMAVMSNINLEPLRKQEMSSCVGESPWGGSSH